MLGEGFKDVECFYLFLFLGKVNCCVCLHQLQFLVHNHLVPGLKTVLALEAQSAAIYCVELVALRLHFAQTFAPLIHKLTFLFKRKIAYANEVVLLVSAVFLAVTVQ